MSCSKNNVYMTTFVNLLLMSCTLSFFKPMTSCLSEIKVTPFFASQTKSLTTWPQLLLGVCVLLRTMCPALSINAGKEDVQNRIQSSRFFRKRTWQIIFISTWRPPPLWYVIIWQFFLTNSIIFRFENQKGWAKYLN